MYKAFRNRTGLHGSGWVDPNFSSAQAMPDAQFLAVYERALSGLPVGEQFIEMHDA